MKYKFCIIRINVTKYDVTFSTKGDSNPLPPPPSRGYTVPNTNVLPNWAN